MAREAMELCLQVLKESSKRRFDSYSVRNSVLIISHNTFRDCRLHTFFDNLSRNNCKRSLKLTLLEGWLFHPGQVYGKGDGKNNLRKR